MRDPNLIFSHTKMVVILAIFSASIKVV
jgi:hypothetical protein